MILIRKEIMDALGQSAWTDFARRLVAFLQGQFPDAAEQPRESLVKGVRGQIAAARGYGMVTEQDIAIYVTSAWLLGGEFDREFPAVAEMMASEAPPETKAEWLEEFTNEVFEGLESGK